jgi:hypothetical protein
MKTIAAVILAVLITAPQVKASNREDAVEVRIVTDEGRPLPTYPVTTKNALKKLYAEAIKGENYRIKVTNRLGRRVGVVVAVDGRNIITGEKSWLTNNERMYILEPYGSGEFSGWRTSSDRINRFYFTDVPDSYAAAFGDESAMGIIAVAAYPEVRRYLPPPTSTTQSYRKSFESSGATRAEAADRAPNAAPAPLSSEKSMKKRADKRENSRESAGTGYGHEEYSPVRIVAFEPEKTSAETIYFKYEWRDTLCTLGVVRCDAPHHRPNRLWDYGGYASPPPGRS